MKERTTMPRRLVLLGVAAALTFGVGVAACSDDSDDGASVREVDGGSGTGSGSGSASASGSGSASGTGSASGSGSGSGVTAECAPVGDLSTASTRVDVNLDEWVIEPSTTTAPAGQIGFVLTNAGEDPHELVIVKGVAPDDLPLDEHGAVDETQLPDGALIGEVEAFSGGTSCNGVFDLEPGEYTLICNVYEESEDEAHLAEGMVTTFTVT
jgi:hypothetical protein